MSPRRSMLNMIIYKVTSLTTGKSYIGQTVRSLKMRKAEHLRSAQRWALQKYPTPLHTAIRDEGSGNFSWQVLEICSGCEPLNEREKFYIQLLNTLVPNGYNQTTGGAVDSTMSEKTRLKIAETMRQNHQDPAYKENLYPQLKGLPAPNKGVPMSDAQKVKVGAARKAAYEAPGYINPNVGQKRHGEALDNLHKAFKETRQLPTGDAWAESHGAQYTPEVRARMRAAKLGKKPANTKRVECIETGQVFNGLKEAAEALGIQKQSIWLQIKGKLKFAGGKTFRYV